MDASDKKRLVRVGKGHWVHVVPAGWTKTVCGKEKNLREVDAQGSDCHACAKFRSN